MLPLIILTVLSQPAADATFAGPTLTIERAVETARRHHPRLRAAAAQRIGASARADQAGAAMRPRLDAGGRFGTSASSPIGSAVDSRTSFSAGLSGSLLLYDFGRSKNRYEAAKISADAQAQDERGVQQEVILGARVAFLNARASKELVEVARQNLANEQRHLAQVRAFVDVGTRPSIDLAKSRTLVANAQVALARAANDYAAAKAQLNAAMGVPGSTDYEIALTPLGPLAGEDSSTTALYQEAASQRPEIAAAAADIRAQSLSLAATAKGKYPTIRLGTDASIGGGDFSTPSWNVSAGISISFSLFDGGETRARTTAEEVSLIALQAQKESLHQQTWLRVEQARLAVRSAKAELGAATEGHAAARELLTLAEGRYQQGAGNAVELADAQLELTNAAARKIAASLKLETARAQLLRTLGRVAWE